MAEKASSLHTLGGACQLEELWQPMPQSCGAVCIKAIIYFAPLPVSCNICFERLGGGLENS